MVEGGGRLGRRTDCFCAGLLVPQRLARALVASIHFRLILGRFCLLVVVPALLLALAFPSCDRNQLVLDASLGDLVPLHLLLVVGDLGILQQQFSTDVLFCLFDGDRDADVLTGRNISFARIDIEYLGVGNFDLE